MTNTFVGVVRTYWDKKQTQLNEEYFVNAGKKEGMYKKYWYNGQLWNEVNYIDGKMNGVYKTYRDNGKLYSEVNYIDNRGHGIYKQYNENGQLDCWAKMD